MNLASTTVEMWLKVLVEDFFLNRGAVAVLLGKMGHEKAILTQPKIDWRAFFSAFRKNSHNRNDDLNTRFTPFGWHFPPYLLCMRKFHGAK